MTIELAASQFADPMWRLNNLYHITNKEGDKVLFKMNTAQELLYRNIHTLNIILKARQMGFSTLIDLFILDQCLFNSYTNAGIIADTLSSAQGIFATKIKFPYDHLPSGLKAELSKVNDSTTELKLSNNSQIKVGTSHRSGTLQILHVSEYGKICAKFPDKADEIRSGALNTVAPGQMVFIESTAEGREGDFYSRVQRAKADREAEKKLSEMDWKFHFFPWFLEPSYKTNPMDVRLTERMITYFAKLEAEQNIELTKAQKAWYAKKEAEQEDKMKQEFPSTPDEAFEVAIEGAYFAQQMTRARKEGRIGRVPLTMEVPVNTFWDIGINDTTNIWLHQYKGGANRFIGYYFNQGEGLAHYINWLREWGREAGIVWGRHYGPHDIDNREFGTGTTRKEQARQLGFRFEVVPRVMMKANAIEAARAVLPTCYFDEENCEEGIKHLDQYRKEWNDLLGVWKDKPRHDLNSHGADAFMTFATGYRSPTSVKMGDRYRRDRPKPAPSAWAV